jgi:hypothetical protein
MQTDIFAHDAVIEGYARQLATQQAIRQTPDRTNKLLVTRINELEEELSSMRNALLNAGKMLALSVAGSR